MSGSRWIEFGLHTAVHLVQRTRGGCTDRGIREFPWKCVHDVHKAPQHRKVLRVKGAFRVSNEVGYRV